MTSATNNPVTVTIHSTDKDVKTKKTPEKKQEKGNRVRLLCMLFLTFGYFLVEIVVGYITGSVALVADSFHMLSDVISLVIAYVAVRMSPKKWSKNTFGWARAEVLGALINAVFLIALCFTIITEAIERIIDIKPIENPKLILIVGSVGLFVNLIGLCLFHEHGHSHGGHGHSHSKPAKDNQKQLNFNNDKRKSVDLVNWAVLPPPETHNDHHNHSEKGKKSTASGNQMNMHGVFLHVLADALGSVIVIISALVIWLTEWEYKMYVDPLLSLFMVILIICSVWPLFVESAKVLLQTVPTHIEIDELKRNLISQIEGVEDCHEVHIWRISGNKIIASAHILCSNQNDFMGIGEQVKEFFHNQGIHSTTIQLEFPNQQRSIDTGESSDSDIIQDAESDTKSDCFLTCPYDDEDADCVSNSCCGMPRRRITNKLANAEIGNDGGIDITNLDKSNVKIINGRNNLS